MKSSKLTWTALLAFAVIAAASPSWAAGKSKSDAASLQPDEERAAQNNLPIAKGGIWDVLAKSTITFHDATGEYSATFPEAVKKLSGQTVTVSGFMLPLESSEKFTHFLLSKRTPTCPFCPPGTPAEIVEVYADAPAEWGDELVTYEGHFELIDNKDLGVFFKLTAAKVRK